MSSSSDERDKLVLARTSYLQSLLSHRIVTTSFSKALYERCCQICQTAYSVSAYEDMLSESSKYLSVLDLEIRQFRDQKTTKPMLAIVNTKPDQLIQGATRYSAIEITYLKKLIEEIFKAKKEAYSIPALEAVRLGSKLRSSFTRDAAEELLKNLVNHRWIDYDQDGIYTLSTRSLLELRNYLQNEFEENYHTCTHCKDVITLGLACSHTPRSCGVRYHYHCARNTIGTVVDTDQDLDNKTGFPCPNCRKPWKSRPIGPKVWQLSNRTGGGGDDDGLFSSQPGPEEEEEEDQEEDEIDQEASAGRDDHEPETARRSQARVKRETRSSGRGARHEEDDDDDEDEDEEDVEQDLKPQRLFD